MIVFDSLFITFLMNKDNIGLFPFQLKSTFCRHLLKINSRGLQVDSPKRCFTILMLESMVVTIDSRILRNSNMGRRFGNGEMSIPEFEKILGDDLELPYFLVGDEVFTLQT